MSEKVALNKIINNEYLHSSTIYSLETAGFRSCTTMILIFGLNLLIQIKNTLNNRK